MRFLSDFQNFDYLTEATLNDSKDGVDYILSSFGRRYIIKFGLSQDLAFKYSVGKPKVSDEVLWIKSSSISVVKFGDIKSKFTDMMFYETTSSDFPWAVAEKGLHTIVLSQLRKIGAVKRGNHFRETAFIITLASKIWKIKEVQVEIISENIIDLEFYDDRTTSIIDKSLNKKYQDFISSDSKVFDAMEDQCEKLIKYLGSSISNISYIVKNSSELLINKAASYYLKDEIDFKNQPDVPKDAVVLNIPARVSLAKWNPSDIWIVYNNAEWVMDDFDSYDDHDIYDIEGLNTFLLDSFPSNNKKANGIIGVSLKQSVNSGILSAVNVDSDLQIKHKYDGYSISPTNKTVIIKFSYKFGTKLKFVKGSEIQCRTFDTKTTSSVYLEVLGSKKSKHMSGKAGSLIESILPPDFYQIKEYIRNSSDKNDISKYVKSEFSKMNIRMKSDLKAIFDNDINNGKTKTANQNSRLQSIIILQWLDIIGQTRANRAISEIVKFAKSESNWSAPHLVAK